MNVAAELHRLETDVTVLWQRWNAARLALIEHPTPARFDACLETFKPWFIKMVGKGWQDSIGAALAEEVRRCNQIMTAGATVAREGGDGRR